LSRSRGKEGKGKERVSELISLGQESLIAREQVVVITRPDSAPLKRLIKHYREQGKVIDLTRGRKARSLIFTSAGFLVLSPLRPRTLAGRFLGEEQG